MTQSDDLRRRILELERDLEKRDAEIKELKASRRDAYDLVDQMNNNVTDANELINSWIETFDMEQDEDGVWRFDPEQSDLWDKYLDTLDRNQKLIKEWNKFAGEWNREIGIRNPGRPLAASDEQVRAVKKLRKGGASIRIIAEETGLGVRTVRTIVEKAAGKDRTSKRIARFRKKEFDRLRAADYRRRKRQRSEIPKKISELEKQATELIRAAKDLPE